MTVNVEVHDEYRVLIMSEQPFRDKEMIKQVPGAKYDIAAHMWFAPLTWAACRQLRGIFGDRLSVGPLLQEWAWNERQTRVDPALKMRAAWDIESDDSAEAEMIRSWRTVADIPPMFPFQESGVKFLKMAQRALLCDDMGTGKTRQTIETLKLVTSMGDNPFPAIVICPNSMTLTWKREFNTWWPGINVTVVRGSAKQRRDQILDEKTHVWIINYEGLRAHSRLAPYGSIRLKRCFVCDANLPEVTSNSQTRCEHCKKELNLKPWTTVIVDEAHRMKDPKAKQTRACWALRTADTKYVYGLTGTAIANNPTDMWPALHMISKSEWPKRTEYINRYCLASWNVFGAMTVLGLKDEMKEEYFDIVDPHMRRMPKEAVLPHLPKKTYTERYVDMTPKQAAAYRQMEDGLITMLGEGITVAMNPLVQLTRMTQFASAYAEIDAEGKVLLTDPSCKVDALLDILQDMGQESAVVFAQSRQLIGLAEARLAANNISYVLIVGGQTPDERELAKEKFQNGQVRVILCTIAAGGIGITLTRSATAIFLQRSWSMVDNLQAEDRVHRIGSEIHDKIEIVDIIALNTLEERQRLVLGTKLDRLEEVMRDKDTLARLLGVGATKTKGRK